MILCHCSSQYIPRAWSQEFHHPASILNMHGQAEATGVVATYLYQSSKDIGNIVPIGQPLPGLKLYLLDPALQPVSPMACGEIYSPGERIAQPFI